MPEPINATAGGVVYLSLSFGVTGAIMGAQSDALVISAVSALLLTFWINAIDSFWRAMCAVLLCSILGGFFSPFLAAYVGSTFDIEPNSALRMACAVVIGSTGPVMFPVALQALKWWATVRSTPRPPREGA